MGRFLRRTFRTLLALLLLLGAAAVALVVALKTPSVQTRLAGFATEWFTQKTGYPITIGGVNYAYPNALVLNEVNIQDSLGKDMIAVPRLEVAFNLQNLMDSSGRFIHLDRVKIIEPKIKIISDEKGNLNLDYFIAAINRLTAPKVPRKKNTPNVPFTIGQARLENGTFWYNDVRHRPERIRGQFDSYHFKIDGLNADLTDFLLVSDTVALNASNLRGQERLAGLNIRELNTRFLFCKQQMRFDELLLKFNRSVLRDGLVMNYASSRDLGDFYKKVRLSARLDSTFIYPEDLAPFSSSLRKYKDRWATTGRFEGTVEDFVYQADALRFGKSFTSGTFGFKGLPDIEQTQMDFTLKTLRLHSPDLTQYAGEATTKALARFGGMEYAGTFRGKYNDFTANGTLKTDFGVAVPNLTMHITPEIQNSTYSGDIQLVNFALGKLIGKPELLQNLDISGKIEGQGFDIEKSNIRVDARVKKIGFQGYDYHDARIDGTLQNGLFEGQIALNDTNLVLDLRGRADIREKRNFFDLEGKIDRVKMLPLGLAKENLTFRTDLRLLWTGTDPDEMYGVARLRNAYLTRPLPTGERNLLIDTLFVFMPKPTEKRVIAVESDLLHAKIDGRFKISEAVRDLPVLVEEYRLFFAETDSVRQEYYQQKAISTDTTQYGFNFKVNVHDARPIAAFLYPDGYIAPGTTLEGKFANGRTTVLSATMKTDSVRAEDYRFYDAVVDVSMSKFANRNEMLASAVIESETQKLSSLAPTRKLFVDASWDKDHVRFVSSLRQKQNQTEKKEDNRFNLNGDIFFVDGGARMHFRKKSQLKIIEQLWTLDTTNQLEINPEGVRVQNLAFRNTEQVLSLNGLVSKDSTETLSLAAEDFNLRTLTPLFDLNISGTLNGSAKLLDVYQNTNLDGNINLDELTYNGFLIGNVVGNTSWDKTRKLINVDMDVDRKNKHILTVKGTYNPREEENPLNLDAQLSQTDLQIFEPFLTGVFSELDGNASGLVQVRGQTKNPQLNGEVEIRQGQMKFDYLGVKFGFKDKVRFSGGDIRANLSLTDENGNPGRLRLGVFAGGDGTYAFDVRADMKDFKILNTTIKDNKLFYGKAFITGEVSVETFDTFNNMAIKAKATTKPGTEITIPIDQTAEVSKTDYIKFTNLAAPKIEQITEVKSQVKTGIKMDLDFDLTPDAKGIVVIDKRNSEQMEAYGRGNIKMKIDTRGGFSMAGTYEIEKGEYWFKYESLVRKKFVIQPNSRISWFGDPYEAFIDIKAVNSQRTSLAPILTLSDADANSTEVRRAYPIDIIISLKDRLMRPTITYGMEIRDYPRTPQFTGAVQSFETRMKTDEQALSNQVGYMLLFGTLISQNANSSFGQIGLLNNLTELASSAASSVFSKIIDGLAVSISGGNIPNVGTLEQVRAVISYNLNDRLSISRDGGFTQSTVFGGSTNANLIGDWAVEWKITQDSRWRAKAFSRFQQNPLQGAANQNTPNVGGSVLFTKSFNYIFPRKQNQFTPKSPAPSVASSTAIFDAPGR